MFSASTPPAVVEEFGESLRRFRPAGFRALARACAEDVRPTLARIRNPTLLIYGESDVRAPLGVAEDLRAAIDQSALVVLPGAGHACNIEAPDDFNREIRNFLQAHDAGGL